MPKENKKRGRRGEAQKRKLHEAEQHSPADDEAEEPHRHLKRRKTADGGESPQHSPTNDVPGADEGSFATSGEAPGETPFYGLLDEQEQEYFKRADGILEINQFGGSEERELFLENVYKEAEGKELKLACSQSCSRLLERLILLSSTKQIKNLFARFSGHFLNLVQHRFASHCCETLFTQAAPIVTQELLAPNVDELQGLSEDEPIASMENHFLYAINELSGNIGYLMTDKFASHTLRVLLVILAGESLDGDPGKSVLRSRKKESIEAPRLKPLEDATLASRTVPEAFTSRLESLIDESVSGLDTHYLRTLATHQVANPMLQLLIQLELTRFGRQRAKDDRSIIRTLLPDDPIKEGSDSASFVNGLLYDPIGSRLLETILERAPGKMFKTLYKELFKERMGSLARNEIASYVASSILERLSRDDLEHASTSILSQVPGLIERGRTAIIKTLIERCDVRGVDQAPLARILQEAYKGDESDVLSLFKLLGLPADVFPHESPNLSQSDPRNVALSDSEISPTDNSSTAVPTSEFAPIPISNASKHASMLAQTMLRSPGPLSTMIFTSLSVVPSGACVAMASSSVLSPILQTALTVPHSPLIFRRKLITRFYSHIGSLSLDPSGSHVVDAIWKGTQGMAFARERVAEELAENENELRQSSYGRKVWRNWCMDLYRRRRGDWVRTMRESVGNDGFLSFPSNGGKIKSAVGPSSNTDARHTAQIAQHGRGSTGYAGSAASNRHNGANADTTNVSGMSKLDLARKRHAQLRQYPSSSGLRHGTGANTAVPAGNGEA